MDALLSRYADAAFWMARYMERAENLARIVDVNETFARDEHGAANWLAIVQINADEERFRAGQPGADGPSVIHFYVLDPGNPTSILSAVAAARENARTLRPLISTEMWAQLNTFHAWLKALTPADVALPRLARLCAAVKEGCQAHTGIVEGTFYRDQGWYFHQIGKYLERADQTTRLLDIKYHTLLPSPADVGSPLDASQWNALLRSAAGYHAFRRVQPRGMHPHRVAEFLLFNDRFPRSVQLCIARAGALITQLKSRYGLAGGNAALERLDEMQAVLAGRPIEQVIAAGLHEFLDWQQRQIIALTADLGRGFFGWQEAA
jgi:uncharacterized alpha-E superfamily protein